MKYPTKAGKVALFKYQPNETPSNPMKATPAADPLLS